MNKDNFDIIGDDFAFSAMIGDPDSGCFPADGDYNNCGGCLPADGMKRMSRMWNEPNILDFPAEGRKYKGGMSPSYLPPPCPDGYVGKHPNCKKEAGSKEFSGSDGYNNAKGDGDDEGGKGVGGKIDADTITAGLETTTELVKLFGTKRALSEVEGTCGKQPKGIFRRKKVKQAWAKCASDYMESKLNASKQQPSKGLSTGAKVGIGIGAVVLIGGIILLVVKMKPKTVVAQAPVAPVAPVATPAVAKPSVKVK
jgi:hypothetical protein